MRDEKKKLELRVKNTDSRDTEKRRFGPEFCTLGADLITVLKPTRMLKNVIKAGMNLKRFMVFRYFKEINHRVTRSE